MAVLIILIALLIIAIICVLFRLIKGAVKIILPILLLLITCSLVATFIVLSYSNISIPECIPKEYSDLYKSALADAYSQIDVFLDNTIIDTFNNTPHIVSKRWDNWQDEIVHGSSFIYGVPQTVCEDTIKVRIKSNAYFKCDEWKYCINGSIDISYTVYYDFTIKFDFENNSYEIINQKVYDLEEYVFA